MAITKKNLQRGYQINMRLLIDTNIILDFYCERDNAKEAEEILKLASTKYTGMIMASQIKDLFYILRKEDGNETKEFLRDLHGSFHVIDLTRSDCYNALHSEMDDIEDAMLSYSANRNKADYIITWNTKDFVNSPVKAITPIEFIELVNSKK